MNKFKIGQQVKVVAEYDELQKYLAGSLWHKVGTVVEISHMKDSSGYDTCVKIEGIPHWLKSEHLEMAESQSR